MMPAFPHLFPPQTKPVASATAEAVHRFGRMRPPGFFDPDIAPSGAQCGASVAEQAGHGRWQCAQLGRLRSSWCPSAGFLGRGQEHFAILAGQAHPVGQCLGRTLLGGSWRTIPFYFCICHSEGSRAAAVSALRNGAKRSSCGECGWYAYRRCAAPSGGTKYNWKRKTSLEHQYRTGDLARFHGAERFVYVF